MELEFNLTGYNLFPNANPSRGLLVYVKETLDVQVVKDLHFNEAVWLKFKADSQSVLVGCIYRSPNSSDEQSTNDLVKLLREVDQLGFDKVVVTGDFNYPTMDWNCEHNNTGPEQVFLECLNDLFLTQLISAPTRVREGEKKNILDLCITNDSELINNIQHTDPLGKSDHEVLIISLNLLTNHRGKNGNTSRYNFNKTNFSGLKEYLSKDWKDLDSLSTNDGWELFENTMHEGFKKFVPKAKPKNEKNKPYWLTRKCLKLIRKKYKFFKRWKETNLTYDKDVYYEARDRSDKNVKMSIRNHEKNLTDNLKENPKKFWKYVNSKLKRNTGIPNLKKSKNNNNDLTSSDAEKAEVLNSFFISVFTEEDLNSVPKLETRHNNTSIVDVVITQEEVKQKLANINASKAMGPDHIPGIVLKTLAEEISIPLTKIFNKSISEGTVPDKWKVAEVSAIYKKGDKTDPGNYRPVSLTCICCKIMESLVTKSLRVYLEENKLISKCQHGFRNHRSCVTQLLETLNDLTNLIENKKEIDIIYLDFSKAFDSVPHVRLIDKLKAYGVNGNILDWIRNFLTDRKQRVRVGSDYSDFLNVTSGIPQGSILGPLLFIVFINDLPDVLLSACKVFADDTKVYNSQENHDILQNDLLSLIKWQDAWQLKFNISKCSVLHIGKKNNKNKYYMNDSPDSLLKETTAEKDVGVTFTADMVFDQHISNVIKKAGQMTGLIRRSFTYLDKTMLKTLIKTIIRPQLEYANVIWSPMYKRQSIAIEKVQRRATKLLKDIRDLPYIERLEALDIPSLKYRRVRADLIQTYKIIHGLDNIDKDEFFKQNDMYTRNSDLKLYKHYCRSSLRKHFFSNRVIDLWNDLPSSAKFAENINLFKNSIDDHLYYLKFDYDQ